MSIAFFAFDVFESNDDSIINNYYANVFINLFAVYLILEKVLQLSNFIWKKIRPRLNFKERYGSGTWAFVTGGSDGIGKEICNELASQGFNLFIVARTSSKLIEFSDEIIKKYRVAVQTKTVDFSSIEPTYEEYKKEFGEVFKSRDFSILVNNVGTLTRGELLKVTAEEILNTIKVNTYPQALLTKIFLDDLYSKKEPLGCCDTGNCSGENTNLINNCNNVPNVENENPNKNTLILNEIKKDLLDNEKKPRRAIINLSSIAAQNVSGNVNVYGPTKTFNDYLSKGLSLEYPQFDILSVRPGFVETPLSGAKKDLFKTVSADICASGLLDNLGYEIECNGCTLHDISSWFANLLPESLYYKISLKISKKD